MSSEQLGAAQNVLKGNLGGAWDINKGYADAYTDLGIARRFGGASAAYSLRDIGAINGRVVKVRRDVDGQGTDPEEDFSASQVASGALEDWVNGKQENTLPADVDTAAAAYSLRKVKASYSGDAVRIRRSSDDIEVDVAFDSDNKVSASSAITNVAEQGGESGQTTDTTLGDFINGTDAFVHTWYDQAGSNDAVQETAANQPKIAENGAFLADGILFDGTNSFMQTTSGFALTASDDLSFSVVLQSSNLSATQNVISQENGTGTGRSWLILSSDDLQTFLGGSGALFGTFTTNKFLYTSIYDDSAATIDSFNNAATSGSQLTSKSVEAASGAINIGESKTGTNRLDGSIEEIIIFKSDQSDNRFKIESNINNYYGLYTFQGDGFVETWYDQSGNGNDATQATAGQQPAIVKNGGIVTENNKNAIDFDGSSSQFFLISKAFANSSGADASIFTVTKNVPEVSSAAHPIVSSRSGSLNGYQVGYTGVDLFELVVFANTVNAARDTQASNTQMIGSAIKDGLNLKVFIDGDEIADRTATTYTASTDFTRIGGNENADVYMEGTMQEIIIFESDKTSDRTAIETEINNHYNIY